MVRRRSACASRLAPRASRHILTHPREQDRFFVYLCRCKRHCLYVVDGNVKVVTIAEAEDDPAGDDDPEDTLAPAVLEMISKVS